ncbi:MULTISPECIES: hypothetical protein [unclassified Streptomyces]|uniref:hypothetical protein n=1 Tax=unclassified Streptomyces TaxID=2593676 RepID=UPI000B501F4D|nr:MULTISPECIES: hypothetical protein [unclassified Streptomyces]MYX01882.1 hypothetical protein [Streptomyces sp. SID8378]SNB91153.1 hypothetical protein SAMN02745831_07471 [Streptomyces sp. PgraA7]
MPRESGKGLGEGQGAMPSGGSEVIDALGAAAGERLREGATPAAVCGELAAQTPWWWDAVLAVGQTLGLPESELLRRLHGEPDRVQGEFRPGEEDLYGELMETLGVFDVAKQLDERELLIVEQLRSAMGAMGGVASGRALGLSRRFALGELASAFRSLAHSGPRATCRRPAEFWEALVRAGELLESEERNEDGTVAHTLEECRAHLARSIRPQRIHAEADEERQRDQHAEHSHPHQS